MNWLIFIHSYLWKNSFRRWFEQPLSLLSKLVVSALLGILGAFVILGIKELGVQLDSRLTDRDALTAVIAETQNTDTAVSRIDSGMSDSKSWSRLGGDVATFYQVASYADIGTERNLMVIAVNSMEKLGLVDDFFIVSESRPKGQKLEFEINGYRSEGTVIPPTEEMKTILLGRNAVLGEVGRLVGSMSLGFTETTILRTDSLENLEQAVSIVAAMQKRENRKVFIQSNLQILRELKKIREIQAQALIWVTVVSGAILGLVFGSLAWMEFREERYLLALIRSFGIGSGTLLAHSLVENCLLAVAGVLIGFSCLSITTRTVDLVALNMSWLGSTDSLFNGDGLVLLAGAALGGLLSGIPVAIGLRKPLGLVLT